LEQNDKKKGKGEEKVRVKDARSEGGSKKKVEKKQVY